MEFMARPAGQGKHTPVPCYASADTLLSLDTLPRTEKSDQQKRRRILDKLKKAIIAYANSAHRGRPLPGSFRVGLLRTEWGGDLQVQLEFDD